LRIFIAGISQETNTFCPVSTDLDCFRRGYLLRPEELRERLFGTNSEIDGFFRRLEAESGMEIIPGPAAWAVASGRITDRAFEVLANGLLAAIAAAGPLDGVLLCLHGALCSQSLDDCDGFLLEKVREAVGRGGKLAASLDYHANITRRMAEAADVLVGYRTYPHTDFSQTGQRAASALLRLVRGQKNGFPSLVKLPLIVPVENTETGHGPMADILSELGELDGLLAASVFCPQPWLDVPEAGVAALAYAQEPGVGERLLRKIAGRIWSRKSEFFLPYPSFGEALPLARAGGKPVMIVDSGDITTAGGAGDSTVALQALLESGLRSTVFIVDARTVENAVRVGKGAFGSFSIGGACDYGYNRNVKVEAFVREIRDDDILIKGLSFSGLRVKTGRRALLSAGALNIVALEFSSFLHDPELLRNLGVIPEEQDVIVQKSHKLFREAYQGIAKTVLIADTPGFTDMNLKRLVYQRVQRPIYPLDENEFDEGV